MAPTRHVLSVRGMLEDTEFEVFVATVFATLTPRDWGALIVAPGAS
jgi:hypothetical protein